MRSTRLTKQFAGLFAKPDSQLCAMVQSLTVLFDAEQKNHSNDVAFLVRHIGAYWPAHAEEVIQGIVRSQKVEGEAGADLRKRLAQATRALKIDGFVVREFFRHFAAGVQLAHDQAPWDQRPDLEFGYNDSLTASCSGRDAKIYVGLGFIARYAILRTMGLQVDGLTANQEAFSAGMEEGRHASQFFSSHFEVEDKGLEARIREYVRNAFNPWGVEIVSTQLQPSQYHPLEIEAEQFRAGMQGAMEKMTKKLGESRFRQ